MFWKALEQAARERGRPINALVAEIDVERLSAERPPNLTSAIRQWLFERRGQNRLSERGTAVRCVVEIQGWFDQLEFHDPKCALVVGDDVHAGISCMCRAQPQAPAARAFAPGGALVGRVIRRDAAAPGSRRLRGA